MQQQWHKKAAGHECYYYWWIFCFIFIGFLFFSKKEEKEKEKENLRWVLSHAGTAYRICKSIIIFGKRWYNVTMTSTPVVPSISCNISISHNTTYLTWHCDNHYHPVLYNTDTPMRLETALHAIRMAKNARSPLFYCRLRNWSQSSKTHSFSSILFSWVDTQW